MLVPAAYMIVALIQLFRGVGGRGPLLSGAA